MAKQLLFDLKFNKLLGWKDFFISKSNTEAVRWLNNFDNINSPLLIIYGPESCGKSHLGRLWLDANKASQILLRSLSQRPQDLFNSNTHFLIDESRILLSDINWSFHFVNLIIGSNKKLLILDKNPVNMWQIQLQDLKSRLAIAPCIKILDPDEEIMLKIVKKLLKEKGIELPEQKLLKYLALIERSYNGIIQMAEEINQALLDSKHLPKNLL